MPTTALRPATEAQLTFLNNLRRERNLPTETWSEFSARNWSTRDASREIDTLKATPRARAATPRQALDLSDLPPSKYLVDTDRGRVHVEIVERRGGRRFVNVLIGAPGDWRRDQVWGARAADLANRVRRATYFDAIGQRAITGPEAAAVRFSREHRVCAACLSPLSDEDQPGYVRGLGPVCVQRFGG